MVKKYTGCFRRAENPVWIIQQTNINIIFKLSIIIENKID